MQHTRNLEKIYKGLSRSEKAQLLQWAARDLGDSFPGIESNPQVCGGEPCIVRTRIPVWLLIQARRLGTSEADLLHSYPTLRAEDLANAWAYERSHRKEIDAQIRVNERKPLTSEEISAIVDGFDPIDWVQMELLAKLPPAKRLIPGLNAQEFSMSALRGTFRKRFPELSMPEINMKVLAYLTPVRMGFK